MQKLARPISMAFFAQVSHLCDVLTLYWDQHDVTIHFVNTVTGAALDEVNGLSVDMGRLAACAVDVHANIRVLPLDSTLRGGMRFFRRLPVIAAARRFSLFIAHRRAR